MSFVGHPSKRLRILIIGGGLSECWLFKLFIVHLENKISSGGLALANGLLNAANTAPLDVLVFEKDTDEYLNERGGYQIRVGFFELSSRSYLSSCLPAYSGRHFRT